MSDSTDTNMPETTICEKTMPENIMPENTMPETTIPEKTMIVAPDPETVAFLDELEDIPPNPEVAAPPVALGDDMNLHAVFDVPVKVQAVLGRSRIPIGELMRLKVGMIIELDRKVGEPVDIFVNDRLIARGEVVLIDDALGITLTEIVRQDR